MGGVCRITEESGKLAWRGAILFYEKVATAPVIVALSDELIDCGPGHAPAEAKAAFRLMPRAIHFRNRDQAANQLFAEGLQLDHHQR